MNKAITDGVQLMPPAFSNNLSVWSRGDGTPGSASYQGASDAAFVPADQDFGGCLELQKTEGTQKLRYKGETPLLRGCYLRISTKVKVLSGSMPRVRVAGYAANAAGQPISGIVTSGPEVTLTTYGRVTEVSAIVGIGDRDGVDMSWGAAAIYGHFGLDLVGLNGGIVRIDDLVIEDITSVFLRDMLSIVDVRDYGAIGDGATDDSAAFAAAASDADGRTVLVPKGSYRLNSTVNLNAPVRFEGRVLMPSDAQLLLPKSFDLPTYIDAFGDEQLGFEKAVQALFNNVDHDALDMAGRKVTVRGPIDVQNAVVNKSAFETRRVIRNGQLEAADSVEWATETVTSSARYDPADPRRLSDVVAIESIKVGALIQGQGVGREVFVQARNEATQEVTLSAPLYGVDGSQDFTFTKYKHVLDFSGFNSLSHFALEQVEIACSGRCSGILLPLSGTGFGIKDCTLSRVLHRGVTSPGQGCEGLLVDRSQFWSDDAQRVVTARTSIGLNINSDGAKLRDSIGHGFLHFAVIGGTASSLRGNQISQGDAVADGVRSAGVVLTEPLSFAVLSGNSFTDCTLEWSNENRPDAAQAGADFEALSVTDNLFLARSAASWTSFVVIKPIGAGRGLAEVSIIGNMFRATNGTLERVDRVDESLGSFDAGAFRNVIVQSNGHVGIETASQNPLRFDHAENSEAKTWLVDTEARLPFGARARGVDAIAAKGAITDAAEEETHDMPYLRTEVGVDGRGVHVVWATPVKGVVAMTVRGDV